MSTGLIGGCLLLAGCTSSEPDTETDSEPEVESSEHEEETDDSDAEDEGLDFDFTEEDLWRAEKENHEDNADFDTGGDTAYELAKNAYDETKDLTNYDQFQDVLLTTLYTTIKTLGENVSTDSSTLTRAGASAVNLVIQEDLEENYEELDIRMMSMNHDNHGYTQVASTHHPLTTVDSNAPIVGPAEEAPLDERDTRDPISRFTDKDFYEVDESDRSTYRGFPKAVYSGEGKLYVGLDPSVLEDYYDEAVFAADGDVWMGPVREAVATLSTMIDTDYFENAEAVGIHTAPTGLPEIEEFDSFDDYVETLVADHIDKYGSIESFRENVLEPQ